MSQIKIFKMPSQFRSAVFKKLIFKKNRQRRDFSLKIANFDQNRGILKIRTLFYMDSRMN